MSNKSICLLMIVKNESHIIKETLDSIIKYINYWVICDTGSTDGTQELIKKYFENVKIQGELFEHEWKNFGYNRTLAFESAFNKSDYVWVIDADDLVDGDFQFPKEMNSESYLLKYKNGNTNYYRKQIFKNTIKWCYRGVLHEYAELIDKKIRCSNTKIDGNYFINSRRLSSRNNDPEKYKKDALLLVEAIEDEPDLKDRYYFYAGQSFRDCKDYENSIKYYKLRIECGGWFEEIYHSYIEIGKAMEKINLTSQEIIQSYLNSYKIAPHRAEGLYNLGLYYIKINDYKNAYYYFKIASKLKYPSDDLLFIKGSLYTYEIKYELGKICYLLNYNDEGKTLFNEISEMDNIPENIKKICNSLKIKNIEQNLDGYDFIPDSDSFGNDLAFHKNLSIEELKKLSDDNDNCVGFNTWGYLKKSICSPQNYINLPNKGNLINGLYIKKNKKFNITIDYNKPNLCIYLGYVKIIDSKTNSLSKESYGSELASINLANQYKDKYNIFIISFESLDIEIDNIYFMDIYRFEKFTILKNLIIDVMIISRYINYFIYLNLNVKKIFLWVHDTNIHSFYNGHELPKQGEYLLKNCLSKINKIICLSEWHKDYFIKLYNIESNKISIIGNGINCLNFSNTLNKIKNRFIYTSHFNRGLKKLINYFHDIHKEIPDSTLHIFRNYTGYEEYIETLKQYDYIKIYGKVSNEQLIEEFLKSEVWFYPTNFLETYCISALEAQMSGCICLATNIGALTTTINDRGILFSEEISDDKNKCVKLVVDTLNNKELCNTLIKKAIDWAKLQDWNYISEKWDKLIHNYIIKCINLERREDRKNEMTNKFKNAKINNYVFTKAIDGKNILLENYPNNYIKNLFKNNVFNYRKCVIGCALSHINIWKELIESESNFIVILEDDVNINDNINNIINLIDINNMDMIFLGYHMTLQNKNFSNKYDKTKSYTINRFEKNIYGGGFFGYIITKNGVNKLLNHINKFGIKREIDWIPINSHIDINLYEVNPFIITSHSVQNDGIMIDSDIQKNFEHFNFF